MRELIDGTALRASTTDLTKKDMKPSFTPCLLVNSSCISLRSAMTPLMSHSLNVVRIAAVCCAMTSCAAILRRRGVSFFRAVRGSSGAVIFGFGAGASSFLCGAGAGLVSGGGAAGASAAGAAGFSAARFGLRRLGGRCRPGGSGGRLDDGDDLVDFDFVAFGSLGP